MGKCEVYLFNQITHTNVKCFPFHSLILSSHCSEPPWGDPTLKKPSDLLETHFPTTSSLCAASFERISQMSLQNTAHTGGFKVRKILHRSCWSYSVVLQCELPDCSMQTTCTWSKDSRGRSSEKFFECDFIVIRHEKTQWTLRDEHGRELCLRLNSSDVCMFEELCALVHVYMDVLGEK